MMIAENHNLNNDRHRAKKKKARRNLILFLLILFRKEEEVQELIFGCNLVNQTTSLGLKVKLIIERTFITVKRRRDLTIKSRDQCSVSNRVTYSKRSIEGCKLGFIPSLFKKLYK